MVRQEMKLWLDGFSSLYGQKIGLYYIGFGSPRSPVAVLLPSCRLPVTFPALLAPVAPLLLACCFPVAVLSVPCCSPVASQSLSCRPPVAILSLPVPSCCFLCYATFCLAPSCCSPVALPLFLT